MNVVISGGSGFIGGALVDALIARGDEPTVLTRNEAAVRARWPRGARAALWDGRSPGGWTSAVEGADAVVNLAGAGIADGRWSAARKLELVKSRIDSARVLAQAVAGASRRPKVFVGASAVGYYGVGTGAPVDESAPQGRDFLAALCGQWEREARAVERAGVRVVLPRFGVVLAEGAGALPRMALPFKLFAGGPLGSGKQGFPWVHIDDAVGALSFALDHESLSGPANLCGPQATDNREFSSALGRALGRPSWLPVPAFALRLAVGEMAEVLLGGRCAIPAKLLAAGYRFKYETADAALKEIYG